MKRAAALFLSAILVLSASAADGTNITNGLDVPVDTGVTDEAGTPEGTDAPDETDTPAETDSPDEPVGPGMSNFRRMNAYRDGLFTDVTSEDWYSAAVGAAYELGLMGGESDGFFNAAGRVTVAQAAVMAARLHSAYHTGSLDFPAGDPWYAPYLSYGQAHGILSGDVDPYAPATRALFADILSRALPVDELEPINDIPADALPDVKAGDGYADSIYALYRAGVLTGSGRRHAFSPGSGISRAEAAAIVARMADKGLRQSFALAEYPGPDLTVLEAKDDTFFARSAILGNSLVEGLRMFSNLKSLRYFSATSVSVTSATQTRNVRLNDGSTGTLVQSLCQEQYDKIYIELGINEIGGSVDTFIQRYSGMIDTIRAAEPDADIYILSVLPVTWSKSASSRSFNMTRVDLYNQALYKLAGEKQCYYMDVCSAYLGSDGFLPSNWSSDGVHLYAQYYSVWENCMRTLYY